MLTPSTRYPTANYGFFSAAFSSNTSDFNFRSDGSAASGTGKNLFNGQVWAGALLNTTGGVIPLTGSLTVSGSLSTAQIPNTLTGVGVSNAGTAGTTHYTYNYTLVDANGGTTISPTGTATTTGNATLNSTNFNVLVVSGPIIGTTASQVCFYRTASGGTPSSTGKIGCTTVSQNALTTVNAVVFNDTGLVGDGSNPPTTNTTGGLIVAGPTTIAVTGSTQCLQVNSAGLISGTGTTCASSFPSAGVAVSTGSGWAASLAEVDGDGIFGVSGSWAVGNALPNGFTATTQSAGDNSTKVATTAYIDPALTLKLNVANSAPTGTFDGSSLTQQKLPVHATFATLANGEAGYDTTNKNWHGWQNGVDALFITTPATTSFTNGDCAQISLVSSVLTLIDAGGACGTSSMVYPAGSGIPIVSTGTTWGTTLSETDGNMLAGVSGAWTKVTALPNGITATTQTALSADTKVATDNYVDRHFIWAGTLVMPTSAIASGTDSAIVTVSVNGTTTTGNVANVLTTDSPKLSFNGNPDSTVGFIPSVNGGLQIKCWPQSADIACVYTNDTSASITPGAITLNGSDIR